MSRAYRTYTAGVQQTPQTEPIPGTIPNAAGGYAFPVDDWMRLRRFLILGSDGGTYYTTERKLTRANAACVERCAAADPVRTIEAIVQVSGGGLAPKQDPALFALALCAAGPPKARALALAVLPSIARTGTHLLHFADYVNGLRGWGRGLRRAIAKWYLDQPLDRLALQLVKYKQRDGWSHRDLLRLSHPKTAEPLRQAALRFAVKGAEASVSEYPRMIEAATIAGRSPADLPRLIREHRLPREVIPTTELDRTDVWEALLEDMPLHALVRNLGKMSQLGLLSDFSDAKEEVCRRLADAEHLRRSRVHPFALLLALRTYQKGHGWKGKLTWRPVSKVVDALDAAFYAAFGNITPTGKRILIGLDVSASMSTPISGSPISAREAACAFAMITARTEPNHGVVCFASELRELEMSPRERLDDLCARTARIPFGGTDCSLPMQAATRNRWPIDAFAVYTDNETWAGSMHPVQALRQYRNAMGRPEARSAVVAFTATECSIADPNDGGMLDLVGLDASLPQVLAEFVAGRV